MNASVKSFLEIFDDEEFVKIASDTEYEVKEWFKELDKDKIEMLHDSLEHYEITDEDAFEIATTLKSLGSHKKLYNPDNPEITYVFGLTTCSKYLMHYPERIRRVFIAKEQLFLPSLRYTLLKAKQLSLECIVTDQKSDSNFKVEQIALELSLYPQKIHSDKPHALLINVKNTFNIGTILRTAKAFGINDIAIIDKEQRVFLPGTLNACRLPIYSIHIEVFDSIEDYVNSFPEHKIYLFMPQGEMTLDEAVTKHDDVPFTLAFGNESVGIPKEYSCYGTSISIPMKNAINSINVCVAAAIAFYKFTVDTNPSKNI